MQSLMGPWSGIILKIVTYPLLPTALAETTWEMIYSSLPFESIFLKPRRPEVCSISDFKWKITSNRKVPSIGNCFLGGLDFLVINHLLGTPLFLGKGVPWIIIFEQSTFLAGKNFHCYNFRGRQHFAGNNYYFREFSF